MAETVVADVKLTRGSREWMEVGVSRGEIEKRGRGREIERKRHRQREKEMLEPNVGESNFLPIKGKREE